jgi:hypothetical protein
LSVYGSAKFGGTLMYLLANQVPNIESKQPFTMSDKNKAGQLEAASPQSQQTTSAARQQAIGSPPQ